MTSPAHEVLLTASPEATQRFGEWLGRHLRPGDVVGLDGELGAGKTTLARGLAVGLGVDDPDAVASPTYLLVVEHDGPRPLIHADAYLPAKLASFLDDGGLEYLLQGRAVVVVEWARNIRNQLPSNTLWIHLSLLPNGGRRADVQPGAAGCSWLAEMPTMF
jgi:tRNA threonylcarbamoyladenosine biosynthesis protein TsaE